MTGSKDIWIQAGYDTFAVDGFEGLKIERLARKAGVSKSSFYHHFADLEVFVGFLLERHIRQAYVMAEKERNAQCIDPELIQVLVAHKTDLLFNRQLRVHRHEPLFAHTLNQAGKIFGDSFVTVWARDLNLQLTSRQLNALFELALENFFLQITPENLTHRWLSGYFANLKRTAAAFG